MEDHHASEASDKISQNRLFNSGRGSNKNKLSGREGRETSSHQDVDNGSQSSTWRKFPGSITDAMTAYYDNQISMTLAEAEEVELLAISKRRAVREHVVNASPRNYDNNLVQKLLMYALQLPSPITQKVQPLTIILVNQRASGCAPEGQEK